MPVRWRPLASRLRRCPLVGWSILLDKFDARVGQDMKEFLQLLRRHLDVTQRGGHQSPAQVSELPTFFEETGHLGAIEEARLGRGVLVCRRGS